MQRVVGQSVVHRFQHQSFAFRQIGLKEGGHRGCDGHFMRDLVDSEHDVLLFEFVDLSLLLHHEVGSQDGFAEIGGDFCHFRQC